MTRAVVVRMRRRAPDEHIEPWRLRINGGEARALRERLSAWAIACADRLTGDFWPDIPEGVADRDADVWEALLAVADLAGGEWPQRAREAAVALVAASKERAPSVGVLLLRDIRTVFCTLSENELTTERLLGVLNDMDESPWSSIRRGEPLDGRGLSQRLGKYGIGSKQHVMGVRGSRGYTRSQFEDAWKRYLPTSVVGRDDGDGGRADSTPSILSEKPAVTPIGPDERATSATGATATPTPGSDVADVADSRGPTPVPLTFTPPTGNGRCAECGFHTPTQGHRGGCRKAA